MADDTGYLKQQVYGSGAAPLPEESHSSGGGNFLQSIGSVLGAVNPVLGVVGNVLGGLFGSKSQSSANKANIAMQRETNALQYRMFNEQNMFNERMWNLQNEYNTPEAQAERLKAAGINPAFVFGNGSVSEAGGVSSGAAPSLTAPHQDPYNIQPSVSAGIDAFMQSQMQSAQIKNMHENERHLAIQNQLDQLQVFDKIQSLRVDNETKRRYLDLFNQTFDAQSDAMRLNNAKLDAETNSIFVQTAAAVIHSQIEQALAHSQINLNSAQIWQMSQIIAQNWKQIQQNAWHLANESRGLDLQEKSVQGQNAYLGQAVQHFINSDAAEFERIGIDKDLLWSKQFSNIMGGTIGIALGTMLGPLGKMIPNVGRTVISGFR